MPEGMYGNHAWMYDLIYADRNYEAACDTLHEILAGHSLEEGSRILEAACGTGRYLQHLQRWYDVAGFDISADMLEIAADRVPDVPLFQADMTEFVADEPYDAVLCMFSSIGYVDGTAELERTCQNFADSLRPGGVVIIEPWLTAQSYEVGRPGMTTYASEDVKLCRQAVARRQGNKSRLRFHWLIARRDEGVEHVVGDDHVTTLFSDDDYRTALRSAGFEVSYRGPDPSEGRGVYIGTI